MPRAEQSIEARLAAFTVLCRHSGFRATPQRLEVLRQVVQTEGHPDVETICARVRQRLPAVSLDTVYRTLRFLAEAGLIQRLSKLQGSARFDANVGQHHHFVCTRCDKVWDFYSEALDHLGRPPEAEALGTVASFHAELHGVCTACQAAKATVCNPRRKPREQRTQVPGNG